MLYLCSICMDFSDELTRNCVGYSPTGLPWNETTIAEYVKQVDYSTAIVGKWHLGMGNNGEYLPPHQGFDYFLVRCNTQLRMYLHCCTNTGIAAVSAIICNFLFKRLTYCISQ